jgi:hypothetical protein
VEIPFAHFYKSLLSRSIDFPFFPKSTIIAALSSMQQNGDKHSFLTLADTTEAILDNQINRYFVQANG